MRCNRNVKEGVLSPGCQRLPDSAHTKLTFELKVWDAIAY